MATSRALSNVFTLRDQYRLKSPRWGARANGSTDDLQAFLDFFTYAESLLPAASTQPDTSSGYSYGAVKLVLDPGRYYISSQLLIPPLVHIEGDGTGPVIIETDYNGSFIKVKNSAEGSYPYSYKLGRLANLRIRGDRTKASQILLDLLRFTQGEIENVDVENAGSHGIQLTECLAGRFASVRANGNVGAGWKLTSSAGPLPCNANSFVNCQGTENDAEGLNLDEALGNTWHGGVFENNYASSVFASMGASETATMRQLLISNTSRGNTFLGTWFEGEANAHVFVNNSSANATQLNTFAFCHFIPKGTGGNVDRAVLANRGTVAILYPDWQASSFRTINGSNAPFRVGKANTGRIYVDGVVQTGTSADIAQMVEDLNGADGNLSGLATVRDFSGALQRFFGRQQIFGEWGNTELDFYRTASSGSTDWDEFAWLSPQGFRLGLAFGGGTAAVDTILRRIGAGQMSVQELTGISGPNIKVTTSLLSAISGATVTASSLIPDGAFVVGVTTRITTTIGATGGTTGFQIGDGVDADRWGQKNTLTAGQTTTNADATANFSGAFTAANDVVITAVGGNFDGTGAIRVSVAYLDATPPAA